MQHKALTPVETDTHVPLLPADVIAGDLEAGALGLDDVEGLEPCSETTLQRNELAVEVGVVLGDDGRRVVHEGLQDPAGPHVQEHQQIQGMCIVVVLRTRAHVQEALNVAGIIWEGLPSKAVAVVPGVHSHQVKVRDAIAVKEQLLDPQVCLDHILGIQAVVQGHGRLNSLQLQAAPPTDQLTLRRQH